jgi:hypothetical protein
MRIWDVDPKILCRKHLLGEHRELHAIWVVISQNKKGYSHHPETKRWVGKLSALYERHELQVFEMKRRGYKHNSPLDKRLAAGERKQTLLINSIEEQKQILSSKPCDCPFD